MTQDEMLNRLRRIEGQLRGVQRLIEEGRPCEEVFTQLAAASNALRRAGVAFFASKLGECLAGEAHGEAVTPERLEEMFVKMG